MYTQLSILDAIREGEARSISGLDRATKAAESVAPGWKDKCWGLFKEWVLRKPPGYQFMIEEFRMWVIENDKLDRPKSDRAFGFLSKKGVKEGLISPAGMAKVKNEKAHRCYANMWQVL